jgi:hypothetical protein
MAQQPLNTYRTITGIVSTTNEELYRAKTGYTSIVLYAQVASVGSGIGTVTFYHQRETRSQSGVVTTQTEIIQDALVPPNDALILLDGRLVLERTALRTDSLRIVGIGTTVPVGFQTNQTPMKYTISLLETLNQ